MDQQFIDQLAEKLSKLGSKRPLGFHYAHPFGKVPADSIQCNGATYNRALYADFFAYATEQGWVKTESEWQSIASSNGGYCPWYSNGDGSTNFRTPKFAPFMQIAIASGNVGNYHEAGLPNIAGKASHAWAENKDYGCTGPFYKLSDGVAGVGAQGSEANYRQGFDASLYNSLFGNSDTVQPESNEWMICVVVMGTATNVGSADVSNVMQAVAQVQAQVGDIPKPNAYVTKTWHSGSSWYRVWSDGFIEQGGKLTFTGTATIDREITFNKPFASSMMGLSLMAGRNSGTSGNAEYGYGVYAYSKTKVSVLAWKQSGSATTLWWYANGY